MQIDLEKVSLLVRMVDVFFALNGDNKVLDEALVDDTIQKALALSAKEYTLNELEAIKRDITWKYQIYTTPGESIIANYDQENWYDDRKSSISTRFWTRYKDHLIDDKKFSPNVVSVLGDETLDGKLMNYIGDPKSKYDFLRRGLIIGDVQSGKTSTYIGFMCKAADAGYKVFILLTGTIESLRRQTQERVEEGFIGIDMSADKTGGRRVGVGMDNKDIFAMAMTSRIADFVGKIDKIAVSLRSHDAIVFVIKKNTSVLTKLKEWLISINADPITKKINVPMLLIDDEADNASINTNASKEDPTKINRLIRELVDVFTKSNYVGFTATPFANVFIDPLTTDEMENHDLFPEDFIVSLPTPSNYIGPKDIFSKNGRYYSQVKYIEDAGREENDGWPFYYKHDKTWDATLPESLTDSIYTFYLSNAIRDLRGDIKAHRSMLVNISRFIDVQKKIKHKIEDIHNNAYRSLKYNLSDNMDESMKDPIIRRIYKQWSDNYKSTEFTWSQISKTIFKSMESIQIKVVNSSKNSEKLEYPRNESLRVIAIGGLALSRGLTLEGLIVSYFYRNTCTYDVLMQMGRWFGYRRGYDDLFRIWTHSDSAEWYEEIAEATETLKDDMSLMRELKLKPKDFGIRVRNNSDELRITASNKMRNSKDEFEYTSYFGGHMETPYLSSLVKEHENNYKTVCSLAEDCVKEGYFFDKESTKGAGEHYIIKNIPKIRISDFLRKLRISRFSSSFDTKQISDFIDSYTGNDLDKWDITFMDGRVSKDTELQLCGRTIYKVVRNNCSIDSGTNRLSIGKNGKLGGPNDGIMGIENEDIINLAKAEYRKYYEESNPGKKFTDDKTYPSDTWFKFVRERNPLLLIYFIDINSKEKYEQVLRLKDELGDMPVTAFAIGMPKNDEAAKINKNKFKVNKIYNWFEQEEILAESEEV